MDILSQILQVLVDGFDAFVGGLMAIICAIIGAKLSAKASDTRAKISRLDDAYDDFFYAYYQHIAHSIAETITSEDFSALSASSERLRRICSEESASIVESMLLELYDKNASDVDMKYIQQLRESSKKDVEDTKRKKRCAKVKKKSANG